MCKPFRILLKVKPFEISEDKRHADNLEALEIYVLNIQ